MTKFFWCIFPRLQTDMMKSFSPWFRSKNFSSSFLSGIVIINIVKFYKVIIEEIWEHSIIKFKHEFYDFNVHHVI